MFHQLKYPKQSEATLSLKYKILQTGYEVFVFHLKNEGLRKVLS